MPLLTLSTTDLSPAPAAERPSAAPPTSAASPLMPPPPPPPLPRISSSDNADAIALRSAISILHLQRERSKADLKKLDALKHSAAANPRAFARDLAAGRVRSVEPVSGLDAWQQSPSLPDASLPPLPLPPFSAHPHASREPALFAAIPTPQNVVRCPAINWAKYQIVGAPLSRLHEEQQARPLPGEPLARSDSSDSSAYRAGADAAEQAPEALIASPYRPLLDKIEPMRTRSVGKKQ
ncbi:MAG: hypothetical protein M1829_002391 [Trizodia sp. TS-e1964]|nr:MAG: hypothetical protein M1829_002391 [Trizodia sp. TS-e1964]